MTFKQLMKIKGYTQSKLVKELNNKKCYKYQQQVSDWCSGKRLPDIISLYYISKILEVTVDDLTNCFLKSAGIL